MPLPSPSQDKDGKLQDESSWMQRCMSNPHIKEFKSHEQQVAVCMNIYKQAKKKKSKGSDANPFDDSVIVI